MNHGWRRLVQEAHALERRVKQEYERGAVDWSWWESIGGCSAVDGGKGSCLEEQMQVADGYSPPFLNFCFPKKTETLARSPSLDHKPETLIPKW